MYKIFDLFHLTFERLRVNRVLVILVLIGLTTATTLALSVPIFIDSVATRLLTSHLPDPPYAFRYRYLGSWKVNIGQADLNTR